MTCLPLATSLSPLELLGTTAGLTTFLVVEETFGKLHRGEWPHSEQDMEDSPDSREGVESLRQDGVRNEDQGDLGTPDNRDFAEKLSDVPRLMDVEMGKQEKTD